MTTTDERGLLGAILRTPAEDTPRLAYADEIEEADPARAEFIRDSCLILARHTDCPVRLADVRSGRPVPLRCGECEYCTARRRAGRFYARHIWMPGHNYAVCFEPTPLDGAIPDGPGITLTVSRGFVSSIRATLGVLLGGPCEFCRGQGHFQTSGSYSECPRCGDADGVGTGRTPGVLGAVFGRQPVTSVVCPGVVRDGIVFRTSNDHLNDIIRPLWEDMGLPKCTDAACWGRGTHAHLTEDQLSPYLVQLGRGLAAGWTHEAVCTAVGPHHGDRCSEGRVQAPNAQFTTQCRRCKGTGTATRPGLPPLGEANP